MKTSISKMKRTLGNSKIDDNAIQEIADKVKAYMKDEALFSKENIIKYVAVAIVAIYGLRSDGWLRGLVLSSLAGFITEKIAENVAGKEAAAKN